MKPIIIGLSGKKGSGKNSIVETLRNDVLPTDGNWLVLDHAFADALRSVVRQLFCIQIGSSEQEKQEKTHIKWENMLPTSGKTGFMTGREVLQVFGTDICRRIDPDVWINAFWDRYSGTVDCIERLFTVPRFVFITDVRFPNEVESILNHPLGNGYIIRLLRNSEEHPDGHASEMMMNNQYIYNMAEKYPGRVLMLDNQNISLLKSSEYLRCMMQDMIDQQQKGA